MTIPYILDNAYNFVFVEFNVKSKVLFFPFLLELSKIMKFDIYVREPTYMSNFNLLSTIVATLVMPLSRQCLQNSVENGDRSVSILGSLCLP